MLRRLFVLTAVIAAFGAAAPMASAEAKGKPFTGPYYGATKLTVDPDTLAALGSLGVTPGVVSPGKLDGATYSFPITNPFRNAARTKVIRHAGGITLSAGGTTVALTDFDIVLRERLLYGKVNGAGPVALLDLDVKKAKIGVKRGRFVIRSIGTTLTQGAADALNGAFGVSAFTDDTVLGVAKVKYRLFPF